MTAIRRRLAFWYTVALGVTMLAFGAALYYERRQSSLEELDRRLALEADLAQRWLAESYRVLGPLVPDASRPALDPGISAYLEAFRDYLVVVDTAGTVRSSGSPRRSTRCPPTAPPGRWIFRRRSGRCGTTWRG
jgi:hypothetical protein